ncbi:CrcB family protein [Bacillaceae bacterium Marseille-Q3522]|nr:CrcB family protein [Bacillaceae bacterium Marseille-Q3522]
MSTNLLFVAAGAPFGALARAYFTAWVKKRQKSAFPLATFLINLSGSFLLGFFTAAGLNQHVMLFIGTGFLGSFTTFSTFQFENLDLLVKKKKRLFLSYIGLSAFLGILLAALGFYLGFTLL